MKKARLSILTSLVILTATILSSGQVAAENTASLSIDLADSGVELRPHNMQDTQSYLIKASGDLVNWSILKGDVTSIGNIIMVEPNGDTVVVFDGGDSDTRIIIDIEDQKKQFYRIAKFPPAGMVLVPAGEFEMGDHYDVGNADEKPVHSVYIGSFYMDQYEVTNQRFCDYLNSAYSQNIIEVRGDGIDTGEVYAVGGSDIYCQTNERSPHSKIYWNGSTFSVASGKENHPMVEVSWYGAAAHCNWRSEQDGLQSCYDTSTWDCDFASNGYRLPTEAEWEYAARGGLRYYKFPWGNNLDSSKANYWESGDPYETGAYPWTTPMGFYNGQLQNKVDFGWPGSQDSYLTADGSNGYMLYDMAGNVFEWCNDWASSTYYSSSHYGNPQGPGSGTYRVLRGGYWSYNVSDLRCADRYGHHPYTTYYGIGFRCVRSF